MTDRTIKVSVATVNKRNVSVKSSQIANEITASGDISRFWAQTSKNWAVSENIVDNLDYSSKYYAQKSKEYSEEGAQTLDDLNNAKTEILNNIQTIADDVKAEVVETGETEKIKIKDAGDEACNTIETIAATGKAELEEIKDNIEQIADDFDNVSSDAITRLNAVDALKTTQITNCITEVPQTVKYEINDGTLTIKAGTIVIIPYGKEDLTTDYPVGSTIGCDKFKVVDTQYKDGYFFIRAELQADVSKTPTTSWGSGKHCVSLSLSHAIIYPRTTFTSASSAPTTTATTWYDTTNNKCYDTEGSAQLTLPIAYCYASPTGFESVEPLNGIGRIGGYIWLDKGVKCLIPDGRNEDGSLKNIEYTTDEMFGTILATNNTSTSVLHLELADGNQVKVDHLTSDRTSIMYSQSGKPNVTTAKWYNTSENKQYYFYTSSTVEDLQTPYRVKNCALATFTCSNGILTSFTPNYAFRAVDYNEYSTGLATKANTDLSNCSKPYVKTTYVNGTSGYRIWSDGYCEQWGHSASNTVSLMKTYNNTNYNVSVTGMPANRTGTAPMASNLDVDAGSLTVNSFKYYQYNSTFQADWRTCGYLASGQY